MPVITNVGRDRTGHGAFSETAVDAFKLEAKNCDVLFASYPKGTVIPPHSHDTENVGVITQGELILTLDGRETRYRAGEWYYVRAKATHAARFDVETSEIEFWFHVPPRA